MNTNDYKRKEDESYIVCSTVCDGENKRRKRKNPVYQDEGEEQKTSELYDKIEENIIFSRNRLNRIIELIAWKIRDPEEHGG